MDKELLHRYVEGNVTAEEVDAVVAWLDADDANVREYMAHHKLYDISLWNHPEEKEYRKRKKPALLIHRFIVEMIKVAAVFAIAWLAFHYLKSHDGKPENKAGNVAWQTVYVPAGQRAEVTLSDGSHIWLNAQSRLSYPSTFADGQREVLLEGEAYFTVQSDAQHPFIVNTPNIDVRALGTEFNVMAYNRDSTFEISLLKGTVELLSDMRNPVRMNVKTSVEWKDGQFRTRPIPNPDYFRWQEGLICVHNEPVGDILRKLERYFDVRIEIKRKNIVNYRYSGKFRTSDGVDQVLRVLQLEHRFIYERDSEQNLITIK
jgi:ferric-dicitrate binding protein FerR (iron transport regulator)